MKERTKLLIIAVGFLAAYYIPWDHEVIRRSGLEAFMMLQEYARQHVLTCLIPAFFIAGAIAVFVSQASVLKYFGAQANKILSYSVASVSGTVLAVCSCTVLPLFAGIYMRGAGIGPATAFLYSGPAINVLAIVLTAKVLGWELGLARAVGAVAFSVITGLLMALIFRKDDANRTAGQIYLPDEDGKERKLWQDALYMLTMVLILVFAAFAKPAADDAGVWTVIFGAKWYVTGALLVILGVMLKTWFVKEELTSWVQATWGFMKQIFPLLLGRGPRGWVSPGASGARSADPGALHRQSRGRELPLGEPLCLGFGGAHVFCDPDGGSDPPGADRIGDGAGPSAVAPAGGTGALAPQHVDADGDHGREKDPGLLRYRRGSFHRGGDGLRMARCVRRRK